MFEMIDYPNMKWTQQNSIDQNEIQWSSELYEFVLSELLPITYETRIISIIAIERNVKMRYIRFESVWVK